MRAAARVDVGLVVALAWPLAAIGLTVALGPSLGLRGWLWLGAHHALCAVGCAHELRRAWARRAARSAAGGHTP